MCGSATFTIVASSTTMSWAVAITTSARPRWRLAGPAAEARPATGCVVDMGLLANGRRNPAPRPVMPRTKSVLGGKPLLSGLAAAAALWRCRSEGSASLRSSAHKPAHLLLTVRGVFGGAQRRGHLADQREQAVALIGAERRAPRHAGQDRLFYLLLQFLAGRGEDEPLNPAVTGIAFPRGQSAFLQHVRDACHERRVTVHPPSKVLHGQRPVEHVQRLDEEGTHLEGLGHPLAPGQEFGDQPDYRVENVEVELVFVRSNVHRAPLSACAYGLPVSYSTVE